MTIANSSEQLKDAAGTGRWVGRGVPDLRGFGGSMNTVVSSDGFAQIVAHIAALEAFDLSDRPIGHSMGDGLAIRCVRLILTGREV